MAQGLNVSRLIRVTINLSPIAAQFQNFDTCLIVGDSDVINVVDRIRSYNSIEEVAADFGTTAPEYTAALLFFSQVPRPTQLYIGRWAQTATAGMLIGGPLTAAQQALANFTAVNDGGFTIAVNGNAGVEVDAIDLTGAANLNQVATLITAALTGAGVAASCSWDGSKFTFTTTVTGVVATITPLTGPTAPTVDLTPILLVSAATYSEQVDGIDAESALEAVTILDQQQTRFYALMFASTNVVDNDYLAVAAFIEAASNPHLFGVTTNEAAALTTNDTTSIGHLLKVAGYGRSLAQYSSSSAYATASLFGRGCTVNFDGQLTVITFMWKQEPGVVAEELTATQADALDSNNYNYFAAFNNNTSILVNGKVANGAFIDEIWDTDWFGNQLQTDLYNLLYTSGTKIPQTDSGNHQLATACEAACGAALNNGTLGPGVWNQAGFGQLQQGDFLPKGYYVFVPPISTQAQANREARKSVPIQIAAKLAGAIHTVDVEVRVNR